MAAFIVMSDEFGNDFDAEDRPLTRKNRVFRDPTRLLDTLDDDELLNRYRLPRHAILELLDIIAPSLHRSTQRSLPMSPELQLMLTLRYLGKGGFQSELGDLHGLCQASVSRAITSTITSLCKLDYIRFQKGEEIQQVKEKFFKIAKFPNVIGCIDGTLVRIAKPSAEEEVAYVCRKGFHAINTQAICDAELRFTNIVCRWPGATHDSFILNQSRVAMTVESCKQGWLLGDSGYACRPWLLTPLNQPGGRAEKKYNGAHTKTRNTVERAFGVLKSRFRCLSKSGRELPFKPGKCHMVMFAACQLHNFCINLRLAQPPVEDVEEDNVENNVYQGPAHQDGFQTRQTLIRQFFA